MRAHSSNSDFLSGAKIQIDAAWFRADNTVMNQFRKNNVVAGLHPLVKFLDGLSQRAPIEELARLLHEAGVTSEDLKPYKVFGDSVYRRNLICENDWYELLCICWRSGQRSPIHDHAQSTCGLRIMEGVCTETIFESTPSGQIKAVGSNDCGVGHVCATQDAEVHQISNLQSEGTDLVTLHIYSPPLRSMATYSLHNVETEIYKPSNNDIICQYGDCI